jgi:hypothetical protein
MQEDHDFADGPLLRPTRGDPIGALRTNASNFPQPMRFCFDDTVVRRIDRLETAIGQRLFSRLNAGVTLTDDGTLLAADVRAMERCSLDIIRCTKIIDERVRGVVRVAITEGLGTYWLMPKLIEFQYANRTLIVRNAELHRDVGGRGGGQRGRRDWNQNQGQVSRDKRREEHKQPQDRAHESIGPCH